MAAGEVRGGTCLGCSLDLRVICNGRSWTGPEPREKPRLLLPGLEFVALTPGPCRPVLPGSLKFALSPRLGWLLSQKLPSIPSF